MVEALPRSTRSEVALFIDAAASYTLLSKHAAAIRLLEGDYITRQQYGGWRHMFTANPRIEKEEKKEASEGDAEGVPHARRISALGHLPIVLAKRAIDAGLIDSYDVVEGIGLSLTLQERAYSLPAYQPIGPTQVANSGGSDEGSGWRRRSDPSRCGKSVTAGKIVLLNQWARAGRLVDKRVFACDQAVQGSTVIVPLPPVQGWIIDHRTAHSIFDSQSNERIAHCVARCQNRSLYICHHEERRFRDDILLAATFIIDQCCIYEPDDDISA
jgi:hypothetical protein